jgi:hypothetical protein
MCGPSGACDTSVHLVRSPRYDKTHDAACAIPQISPVTQDRASLEVNLGKMDTVAGR